MSAWKPPDDWKEPWYVSTWGPEMYHWKSLCVSLDEIAKVEILLTHWSLGLLEVESSLGFTPKIHRSGFKQPEGHCDYLIWRFPIYGKIYSPFFRLDWRSLESTFTWWWSKGHLATNLGHIAPGTELKHESVDRHFYLFKFSKLWRPCVLAKALLFCAFKASSMIWNFSSVEWMFAGYCLRDTVKAAMI